MKIKTLKLLCAASMGLMLEACGGGDGSALQNTINAINNVSAASSSSAFAGNASSNSSTSSINTTTINNIGIGTGSSFIANKIGIDYDTQTSTLSAGGTTTLTVNLVSITGTLVTQSVIVTFNSTCVSAHTATLSTAVVTTTNGTASTTYTAQGCGYDHKPDLITATAAYDDGKTLTAQTSLTVDADSVQTIAFVDATPALINLKGTGGTETSVLRFRVLGQKGAPMQSVCVSYSPNTTQGGLGLVPSQCTPAGGSTYESMTDANGYASTTVQSGTVSTPVRITATTDGKTTQSSNLVVTTGIPDQNSISLSAVDIEPIAWDFDGIETAVTVFLADAFNNLVPDGTAVTFTTSGGSIGGSCTTTKGTCSVTWRSQNPRPVSSDPVIFSDAYPFNHHCTSGAPECRSGRIKILATAIGNESFIDGNGNGVYDDIEKDIFVNSNGRYNASTKNLPITNTYLCSPAQPQSSAAYGIVNSCDDLREAYVDKTFNGDHDDFEEIVDFNQDGIFNSLPNGKYDGVLCAGAAKLNGDCTNNKVSVRAESTLTMSSQQVFFQPHADATAGRLPGQPNGPYLLVAGGDQHIQMMLADENGNGMPAGTTVSVRTGGLTNAAADISPTAPLSMAINGTILDLHLKADSDITKKPSGSLSIDISAPNSSGSRLITPVTINIISN